MDEIQAMRDVLERERDKTRPLLESLRMFLANARGLRNHASSCHTCRIQQPTMFTCPLGATLQATTSSYLSMVEKELGEIDGAQFSKKDSNVGSTTSENRSTDNTGNA